MDPFGWGMAAIPSFVAIASSVVAASWVAGPKARRYT